MSVFCSHGVFVRQSTSACLQTHFCGTVFEPNEPIHCHYTVLIRCCYILRREKKTLHSAVHIKAAALLISASRNEVICADGNGTDKKTPQMAPF